MISTEADRKLLFGHMQYLSQRNIPLSLSEIVAPGDKVRLFLDLNTRLMPMLEDPADETNPYMAQVVHEESTIMRAIAKALFAVLPTGAGPAGAGGSSVETQEHSAVVLLSADGDAGMYREH